MNRRLAGWLCSLVCTACAGGTKGTTAQTPAPNGVATFAGAARPAVPPSEDYFALVASEAVDQIAVVRFGPSGIRIERTATTGMMPADVDGPHGVAVSPDGKYYYVSTAHGTPYGYLWKYATANDSLLGRVMLGNFPATLQVTPDGAFAYVVNFNVYGEMVPSSVSIVSTDEMVEVARVTTCTMPHGSRVNREGTKQYSACMMDDMAVEIDTRTFGVSRHFVVSKGKEQGMHGAPTRGTASLASHDMAGHGMEPPKPGDVSCSPTWAQPSVDGSRLFVACNKSNDIVEIDVAGWRMLRRIPAGDGVYNLAVTHDGKLLVATNKRGKSASIIDIASGTELARIPTTRRVVHGAAVSSDDRYAFISQEGIGSEPGAVDVIDLRARQKVATINVGQQAGGIDFWKVAPSRP
jgi:DNA-binding beta-propeller fold protein YncE